MASHERLELYRPGGLHPVRLGDRINDRYVILHKLGHGGGATIWLATDLQHQQNVALKILAAVPEFEENASTESAMLNQLHTSPSRWKWWRLLGSTAYSSGMPLFPTLIDKFVITGPNGSHCCVVTEAVGPSLSAVLEEILDYGPLPIQVARKISLQLMEAVAIMHGRGITHGDLHPGNILFLLPGLGSWPTNTLCEFFGQPEKVFVDDLRALGYPNVPQPSSHLPEYLVRRPPINENILSLCFGSPRIKVIDFGEAFYSSGPKNQVRKVIGTPPAFAAPEVQLQDSLSSACDIWSLGCLLYHIFTGAYIFQPMLVERRTTLIDFTICFGKLPEPWWEMWKDRERYYHQDGTVKPEAASVVLSVRGDFEKRITRWDIPGMEHDERSWFYKAVEMACRLKTEERAKAATLLQCVPFGRMRNED